MKLRGRPLRFLLIVGLSWVVARLYFISPFADDAPAVLASAPPSPPGAARGVSSQLEQPVGVRPSGVQRESWAASRWYSSVIEIRKRPPVLEQLSNGARPTPLIAAVPLKPVAPVTAQSVTPAVLIAPPAPGRRQRRLAAYAYAFVREGSGGTALVGDLGQLGGSQAGVRLDFALNRHVALTARLSAPLTTSRDREAAFGFKLTPSAGSSPAIYLERRQSLGRGGRDAFALTVAGGTPPVSLPQGFRLETYAQAGMVGLKRRDLFVEGQATALRDVATRGRATLALGAGVWGGAQPGVERVDIGPRARVGLPLGGDRSAGLALDYRYRIVGSARPGSGVALTLDTSF